MERTGSGSTDSPARGTPTESTGHRTKLRVCHLISGDLWAGAEAMAFNLLVGLTQRPEIDVFAILLNRGTLADELDKAGVETCVLDERRHAFPRIVGMAARAVKRWAPDLLHSHRYKENLLSYLVSLALKEKVALVSTQHGMPEIYARSRGVLNRLKQYANSRLLASKFDRTVVVSADMRELLAQVHGFRESRLEVIHNGIAIPEFRGGGSAKKDLVVGSAGRLVAVKDYPLMIEVAKLVCGNVNNIRFELAGDGPLLDDLKKLVREQGLETRFTLKGFVSDLRAFYAGLDVFVNTSLHEGIPMSVLEAMACGVPPVVSGVGGLREIVTDGVDGYLVSSRNPIDFAQRCVALCSSETLRRNMARAAREKVVGKFALERMVREYLDLYVSTQDRWACDHR